MREPNQPIDSTENQADDPPATITPTMSHTRPMQHPCYKMRQIRDKMRQL